MCVAGSLIQSSFSNVECGLVIQTTMFTYIWGTLLVFCLSPGDELQDSLDVNPLLLLETNL